MVAIVFFLPEELVIRSRVRRNRAATRQVRLEKLKKLRSLVEPFNEDEVDRYGERVFIDKLVAKRLRRVRNF